MTTTAARPSEAQHAKRTLASLLNADGGRFRWVVAVLMWAAGVLMIISGYIHLHLYDIAYKHVATIGPLFIVQGIASMVFAIGFGLYRRAWTALLGAGTMIATVVAFLISVNYGLFGFQDSFTGSNAIGAFVIEISSAVLFLAAAAISITARAARPASAGGPARP